MVSLGIGSGIMQLVESRVICAEHGAHQPALDAFLPMPVQ